MKILDKILKRVTKTDTKNIQDLIIAYDDADLIIFPKKKPVVKK